MDGLDTAVIEGDASTAVADEAKKPKARSTPKWENEARDRLKNAIRRYSKPLADLVARDANEGDTRLLVTDFLCDGLGFDKYADLTTEYQVKGEFADYGVRIDRDLVAFIEVKRVATKLSTRHLRQVEMYAVNEGVEWIILTNGSVWQVYHITGGLPVVIDLALEVDLLGGPGCLVPARATGCGSCQRFARDDASRHWVQHHVAFAD
jgi:Type I restriction enzyme R protein N terminus (HSDR_N)